MYTSETSTTISNMFKISSKLFADLPETEFLFQQKYVGHNCRNLNPGLVANVGAVRRQNNWQICQCCWVLHTLTCILHPKHCTLNSTLYKLHSRHYTLHTTDYTLHTTHYKLYSTILYTTPLLTNFTSRRRQGTGLRPVLARSLPGPAHSHPKLSTTSQGLLSTQWLASNSPPPPPVLTWA